jgi:predicted nucleotidyltransferase component of viral defense system
MIPKDFITEWRNQAPWDADELVEQDLILSRAIVEIFKMEELSTRLAWRGGTALYKLYFNPAARYSEDIDLVQIKAEPIGETFSAIRRVLDPWLGEPRRVIKRGRVNLVYRFQSEEIPPKPMKLKIEINSREHFSVLGFTHVPFKVRSRWWSDQADITTYHLDELLGTKLRALYQRKKGRDLFDIWYSLTEDAISVEQIIKCFEQYMSFSGNLVSRAQFEENLSMKISDPTFRADITPLLRPGISWNPDLALALVKEKIITKLKGEPWRTPQ